MKSKNNQSTPAFFQTHPRVCALILAATVGSRLYPMTSKQQNEQQNDTSIPKHLLPIAGIPCLLRLLDELSSFKKEGTRRLGLDQIVIAIAAHDTVTLEALQHIATLVPQSAASSTPDEVSPPSNEEDGEKQRPSTLVVRTLQDKRQPTMYYTVIQLREPHPDELGGSLDAIRQVEEVPGLLHPQTQLVILPGDIVFLPPSAATETPSGSVDENNNIHSLDSLVRPDPRAACTTVLVDVGEKDEHGVPLKESAKAKRGGLSRDEEEIEYIALSYSHSATSDNHENATGLPRIVMKQPRLDVETDTDLTGSTPKLLIPKARLRPGRLAVGTEWNDVHMYSLAPWVRQLIQTREGLSSIQTDLIPLLVSRQFRGKRATVGSDGQKEEGGENQTPLLSHDDHSNSNDKENNTPTPSSSGSAGASTTPSSNRPFVFDEEPYSVLAKVLPGKTILRSNTIPSYLYACRELVKYGADATMPPNSKWNGKFHSLVMEDATIGPKINMKSAVVGKGCTLGAKCRLNNVVIMDQVTIGENCSLQNTVIGFGAVIGDNVSLNDCQVGPKREISAGTKEKGESFMAGDGMEDEEML